MKTFLDLIEEVQKPGLCHHCGGCVTFCTSINYGALELDPDTGMPRFGEKEKCIECGLCYAICPEINELEEETHKKVSWEPPIGKVIEVTTARSIDLSLRSHATDGGVVTALLLHLLKAGRIDGAIVTRQTGPFHREPFLATTEEEIRSSAGFYFDTSQGIKHYSHDYSTYSPSVQEFRPMIEKGLHRIALVGTPCQIKAVRKIETLGIVPSDSIKFCFGLFCSGNFFFGEEERKKLEEIGKFQLEDLKKVNVKEDFIVHLNSGKTLTLPLKKLDFMKRYACRYCKDYSAEYADISFGGIGSKEGFTTVITRSPIGRAIFADAKGKTIEVLAGNIGFEENASKTHEKVRGASSLKKKQAEENHKKLEKKKKW